MKTSFLTLVKKLITVVAVSCLAVTTVSAEDTEIFFGGTNANSGIKPNVMFILDTSGSMTRKDGGSVTRLDRMKNAIKSILTGVTNINVGLMRFSSPGGPVLYPVSYVDEDVCVVESCSSPTLQVPVSASGDDAEEKADGNVVTSSVDLELMEDKKNTATSEITTEFSVNDDDDDAEEYPNGSMGLNSTDLEMVYQPGSGNQTLGIRFDNINIPQGAIITNAELVFQVDEDGSGTVNVHIHGENIDNAPTFAYITNNITNRTKTSAETDWLEVPNFDVGNSVRSPSVKTIVQEIVNRGGWASGNAMVFIISNSSGSLSDNNNRRIFESRDGSKAPKLRISYITGVSGIAATQTIGLRFQNVKIPQGAIITSAYLDFESDQTNSETTNVTIKGEAADDAVGYIAAANNVTGRTTTGASVAWNAVPAWTNPDQRYQSPNLKAVVQEIVNRTGWCGGNAMAFVLTGSGNRTAKSYDGSSGSAPILKVTYDTSSLTPTQGCTTQTIMKQVSTGSDDAEEKAGSGNMSLSSSDLELVKDGSNQIIGIRFRNLQLPQGAIINQANLEFEIDETPSSSSITLNVYAQAHDDAPGFKSNKRDISDRTKSGAKVTWAISATPSVNQKLTSPDIKTLVQEIINRPGWIAGNDLVIIMDRQSGSGRRVVESYNGETTGAPKLTILAKWNAGATTQGALLTVRNKLIQLIDDLQYKGSTPIVDTLYEAALYFKGLNADFGKARGQNGASRREYTRVSHPASYTGGSVSRASGCTDANLNATACRTEVINGTAKYKTPMISSCQRNYIVLLTDGAATFNYSASKVKAMASIGNCADSGSKACGPELTKYLFENDQSTFLSSKQNIITYTIGFNFSGQWLKDVATNGGGAYYEATSSAQLTTVFTNIIAEILKVDTTFVSPGAAVNQFNRLTHRDEIYFSLFKPDDQPYWPGNLKRYAVDGNPSTVVDKNGALAVDTATGFFNSGSQSFWSTSPDGSDVSKGGFVEQLSLTNRKVYTYTGSNLLLSDASNNLHESNAALTLSLLNIAAQTTSYRTSLLQWARGVDIKDYDNDTNVTEMRNQVGDPLHSRPVIVTYGGSDASPDTTIFVATNEGFLYALSGETGKEYFSFIPQELLVNLDTYYTNASASTRPYGLDGAITTWVVDVDGDNQIEPADGDKVYIFVGMRRGGRNYYALDVTDRTKPRLLWTIKGGTAGYNELGQTWSAAVPSRIRINTTTYDVLIFSGGYDADQDTYTTRTADTEGRAIYIVNMADGAVLWTAGVSGSGHTETYAEMQYSIPSDVRVLDVNGDGLVDQMWVGDMGGQIWRFDIHHGNNVNGLVTGAVVADLAGAGTTDNRRFYYSPDISLVKRSGILVLNIAIGSGWRAHPLDLNITDRFYAITTTDVYAAPASYSKLTEANLYDASANILGEGNTGQKSTALSALESKAGWYMTLEVTGEKVLAQSVTINNQILFSTYIPSATTSGCQTAQGGGRVYLVNIFDGTPVKNLDTNGSTSNLVKTDRYVALSRGGIPPAPTPFFPDNGADPIILIGPELGPSVNFGELTGRTFWYEK